MSQCKESGSLTRIHKEPRCSPELFISSYEHMSSVHCKNSRDAPVGYIEFQAEPPVQHVCGFTNAWFQCHGFRLALKKEKTSRDE